MTQLERDEVQAGKDINTILSGRSSIPINHDIIAEEEKLIALYRKQDELRSRKDALAFAKDMVDSFLLRFSRSSPKKDSKKIDSGFLKQKILQAKNILRNCCLRLCERCRHQSSIRDSSCDLPQVECAIRKNSIDVCKGFITAEKVVLPYKGYLDLWKDDIERPYALSFKIKCYSIREVAKRNYFHQYSLLGEEKANNAYEEQLNKLPPIEELYKAKSHNPSYYLELLRKLLREFNLLRGMKSTLAETVCLRNRKEFLLKAITLFEAGEFSIVNCIIPMQIEGIFFDLLLDQTTFSRFKDLDLFPQKVLKDKIKVLLEMKESIYPEAAEYFQNYYNNLVRNPAAHGRYYGNNDPTAEEIAALEQILDLNFLVYMVSRISETDKMHRFIKGYVSNCALFDHSEHPCFHSLFNEITGRRTHADYDMLDVYEPLHIAFWIVNPYYERIYKSVDDGKDLMDLRKEFLSPEFWSFVLSELDNTSYKDIHKDFGTVITGLFRCNISAATKVELQKVNKKYGKMKR